MHSDYEKVGCSRETHVVMPFGYQKADSVADPHGMSGSPVWLLFDEASDNDRTLHVRCPEAAERDTHQGPLFNSDLAKIVPHSPSRKC